MDNTQIQNQSNSTVNIQQPKKLTNYLGVDLTDYQCYELKSDDPLYSTYKKTDLHYVIGAKQKGLKPPTKIGLKRMKRKNHLKRQALKAYSISEQDPQVQSLNPQSPELICMKALRRQFKQIIAPDSQQDEQNKSQTPVRVIVQKQKKTQEQKNAGRKPKFIRKKQNQLRRRIELIDLVHKNYSILVKIFGRQKLKGHDKRSKCPKISRQQVKQALKKNYQETIKLNEQNIKNLTNPQYANKIVEQKIEQRKRNFQYFQKNHLGLYRRGVSNQQDRLIQRENSDSESGISESSSDSSEQSSVQSKDNGSVDSESGLYPAV